ncbi:hypothetical protein M5K25_003883 [Dendrobium thyrsiflorum]|uniref:Uncharacterized protein n=1 Tax=Dendrobium thyrsiflorum TaxID=117978 RepID=A0ABD0VLQ6_DENTH
MHDLLSDIIRRSIRSALDSPLTISLTIEALATIFPPHVLLRLLCGWSNSLRLRHSLSCSHPSSIHVLLRLLRGWSTLSPSYRIRSYDILIGSNNGSSLATKVAFPLSKASLASSLLFDLAPMRAFPSCRIGSYNILIGSKHRSSFTVKVTFSLTSATSTKSHKFATKRGKQRIYFTVRFTG